MLKRTTAAQSGKCAPQQSRPGLEPLLKVGYFTVDPISPTFAGNVEAYGGQLP